VADRHGRPATRRASTERKVDVIGSLLCVLGLGGAVFAPIEPPQLGWSDPAVTISLIGGVILFVSFLVYESRASDPMLRVDLFKS
jgi:cyanate permease